MTRDPRIDPRPCDSIRVKREGHPAQRRFVLFVNSAARSGKENGLSLIGWGTRRKMSSMSGHVCRQSLGEWRHDTVDAEVVDVAPGCEP